MIQSKYLLAISSADRKNTCVRLNPEIKDRAFEKFVNEGGSRFSDLVSLLLVIYLGKDEEQA